MASEMSLLGSLRFRPANGRHNSVHAEIFDHLSVMVVGVRDSKLGQTQACGFALPCRLQHVVACQCGSRSVTQGKGVFEERDDFSFGFYVRRTVAVPQAFGQLVAGERGPDKPVRGSDVLNLHRK